MKAQGNASPSATDSPANLNSPVPPASSFLPANPSSYPQDVEAARVTAEVQGMMVMAKRFPRDETAALSKILTACTRKGVAESAIYAFRRGGSMVTGPSIRLAEILAQCWGNLYTGVEELGQIEGESKMLAFAWDLETNTRDVRKFIAKHERAANGTVKALTDSRDIYEMTANLAARRKRAAILAVIPPDIIDSAVARCEATLAGDGKEPIEDKIRKMVLAFKEVGVSQEAIETRLGHKLAATIAAELIQLHKIYVSIRDGMSKREEWFKLGPGETPAAGAGASELNEKLSGAKTATDQQGGK